MATRCRPSWRWFSAEPRSWEARAISWTLIAAFFLTQLQQLVLTTDSSIGVQFLFQGGAIIVGVAVYTLKLSNLTGLLRMSGGSDLTAGHAGGSSS
jgi:hypothetical protein